MQESIYRWSCSHSSAIGSRIRRNEHADRAIRILEVCLSNLSYILAGYALDFFIIREQQPPVAVGDDVGYIHCQLLRVRECPVHSL